MTARPLSTLLMSGLLALAPGLLFGDSPVVFESMAQEGVPVGKVSLSAGSISIQPNVSFDAARLTIKRMGQGIVFSESFEAGGALVYGLVDSQGNALSDGLYVYEFMLTRQPLRNADGDIGTAFHPVLVSGTFEVRGGAVFQRQPDLKEIATSPVEESTIGAEEPTPLDFDVTGDLSITGGACVGCPLATSVFDGDWHAKGGFPRLILQNETDNDDQAWTFVTQDSGVLQLQDELNGVPRIQVEEDGPANQLYLDSSGAVGFGTSAPLDALHALGAKTIIRLENTTSGTTWRLGDLSDGDFTFFIDTNGGTGPTGEIMVISESGNVGIRQFVPEAPLHVTKPVPGGNAAIVESGALNVKRTDGIPAAIRFSTAARDYLFNNNPTGETFSIRDGTGGQTPFIIYPDAGANVLSIRNNGVGINRNNPGFPIHHSSGARLTLGGTWTNASSRALKTEFQAVESGLMLSRLMELPVESWSYKAEVEGSRHVGPVAEDFQRIFGLGDGETISTTDADGVMMAAIQGLKRELDAKNSEIETLRTEFEALKALLEVE